MDEQFDTLLAFFKALADESRLRIVGVVAQEPQTGEDLAARLGLSAGTVSHHLGRLVRAGLVNVRADQYYRVYSLDTDALHEMAGRILRSGIPAGARTEGARETFEAKVLRDFLADGRLKTMPRQRKKRRVVLRQLVRSFEAGRSYSEREVNDVLSRFHEDVATIRREFIAGGLMSREGGHYRRVT